MKSLLHIGADVDGVEKTLPKITDSVLKILGTSAGDDVKIKALDILQGTFKVENVNVINSIFNNKD